MCLSKTRAGLQKKGAPIELIRPKAQIAKLTNSSLLLRPFIACGQKIVRSDCELAHSCVNMASTAAALMTGAD